MWVQHGDTSNVTSMGRSVAILAIGLCLGCMDDRAQQATDNDDPIQPDPRSLAIIERLKLGTLQTVPPEGLHVEYDSDGQSGDRSFRCTAQGPLNEIDVTFLYPGRDRAGKTLREFSSREHPLQRVTIDNDLYTTRDTMDVNIVYTELNSTVEFLCPVDTPGFLLILSTPMNWTGRIVGEWQFVQLVSFTENRVYELAIPA